MDFSTLSQAYGPAAAIIIAALVTVVIYLYKARESERKDSIRIYNELQEKRLLEALETQDKLINLVNEQKELPERIYNLAISRKGKRN